MKYRYIRKSSDILKLLQYTANALLKNEIEESKAKTLTYICSTANQVIKTHDIEQQIKELEQEVKKIKSRERGE